MTMTAHHRSEKRLPLILDKNQFSCMMNRATPVDRKWEKPHLLFHMEMRYCIKCNTRHWFLGEKIEFEQADFDPNEYWSWQLEEMGFFDKGHDTNRPKN